MVGGDMFFRDVTVARGLQRGGEAAIIRRQSVIGGEDQGGARFQRGA